MRAFATAALAAACVAVIASIAVGGSDMTVGTLSTPVAAPGFAVPIDDGPAVAENSRESSAGFEPDNEFFASDEQGGLALLASSAMVRTMWDWCRANPDPTANPDTIPQGDRPDAGIDRGCSWRYWLHHTDILGPQAALEMVLQTRLDEPGFVPECHHSLHGIGQRAAILLGAEAALEISDGSCQAGYIHGVLQEWTTMGEGLDGVNTICEPLRRDDTFNDPSYAFCGHGIGHAVALRHPASLIEVINLCQNDVNPMLSSPCIEGAVMEFSGIDHVTELIKRETGNRPSDNVTDDDRRYACDAIWDDDARERCWMRVFMLFEPEVRGDIDLYVQRCNLAQRARDQVACLASWSEQSTSATPIWGPGDPLAATKANDMFDQCDQLGNDDAAIRCITQTVEIIWRDEPMDTGTPSFCPDVDPRWRDACVLGDELVTAVRRSA